MSARIRTRRFPLRPIRVNQHCYCRLRVTTRSSDQLTAGALGRHRCAAGAAAHRVLIPLPANLPLRCRCVSETPIYDQLRGERINADVPDDGADRQRVGQHGHHRAPDVPVSGPAVPGRPAASGSDPPPDQQYSAAVEQAVQAALSAARRARFAAGTRAARRPATHARHRAAHAAGNSQAPADSRGLPARDAATFSWFERPA